MGSPDFMKAQIKEKLAQDFRCIKMKIGAIDFEEEYRILKALRNEFSASDIEIRVDANGAFQATEALRYLERLATLQLHSIEQPIRAGQWEAMAELCELTPLPIALDEELIGIFTREEKQRLLREIQPQYIILKPSLIGGYSGSEEWITLAETLGIGWWVTSALESNIGLNAIAQWTYTLRNPMPQGLGTGTLYTNNIPFPLYVENGHLGFNPCERVTFPFS
jgi:mandelate racemase/muconate lactonizing protein